MKPTPFPKGMESMKSDTSLFCLSRSNPLRRVCITITQSTTFERFIIACIIANCIMLAMYDPTAGEDEGRNRIANQSEIVFVIIFTIEMILKIIAMGFVMHESSYLRDGWNRLDFVIVLSGIASLLGGSNYSGFRALRVLRPIRAISSFPQLRILVNSLIQSFRGLANVGAFFVFLLVVAGLIAVQLWKGVLHQQCYHEVGSDDVLVDPEDYRCSLESNTGRKCPSQTSCLQISSNPNLGVTSFDHMASATLTLFQCITLEGWSDIMYLIQDAYSSGSAIFFILFTFFGGIFLINLALVVINQVFLENTELEKQGSFKEENADGNEAGETEMEPISSINVQTKTKDECECECECEYGDDDGEGEVDPEKGEVGVIECCSVSEDTESGEESAPADGLLDSENGSTSSAHGPESDPSATQSASGTARPDTPSAFRRKLRAIVEHKYFMVCISILIVLNTLIMASEHYGMSRDWETFLQISNYVFTAIFTIEMIMKIVALGWNEYIRDRFNVFDMIVVVASVVEIIMGDTVGIRALRAFRLLRIMRLARSWTGLRTLLGAVVHAMSAVAMLSLLLFLFIFTFALLGMQFFGGKFPSEVRSNFNDLYWAHITVFQVLSGENWNEVMYVGMDSTDPITASVYFVVLVVLGNYVILNLFVAILLQNISDSAQTVKEEDEIEQRQHQADAISRDVEVHNESECDDGGPYVAHLRSEKLKQNESVGDDESLGEDSKPNEPSSCDRGDHSEKGDSEGNGVDEFKFVAGQTRYESGSKFGDGVARENEISSSRSCLYIHVEIWKKRNTSLCLFEETNPFRILLWRMIQSKAFEFFILFLILISCIALTLENPRNDPDSDLSKTLYIVDIVLTICFAIEALMKIMALGFVFHETAYLRSGWNRLDFIIVCTSIFGLLFGVNELSIVKALRCLRPLRFVSRLAGMRAVVQTLVLSIPPILNVGLVSVLFFVIFGILGIQMFMGRFFHCETEEITGNAFVGEFMEPIDITSPNSKEDCVREGYSWANRDSNFDNIFNSLLTLFQLSTTEGWVDTMYNGVDAREIGLNPKRNAHPENALYFVGFIIVGNFFMINLFVGVLIDTYYRLQEYQKSKGISSLLLTEAQQRWKNMMKVVLMSKPTRNKELRPKDSRWRQKLFDIVSSRVFETVIMGLIVLNVVIMCTEHYDQSDDWAMFLFISNVVFTSLFAMEATAKITALGPMNYFRDRWNVFDFIVVVLSILGFFFSVGFGATIFRVFRVFRVFRLVRAAKGIKMLLITLLFSLFSLLNVGSLLCLLFFIYAVLGVQLFSKVKRQEALNRHANFESFPNASLLLYRMSTGESWDKIMHECMVEPPECSESEGNCGTQFAPLYFVSFVILGTLVLLNLLIAIILENFDTVNQESEFVIGREEISEFKNVWAKFDPKATGFIPLSKFPDFLVESPQPLGFRRMDGSRNEAVRRKDVVRFISQLNLRPTVITTPRSGAMGVDTKPKMIAFSDALLALAEKVQKENAGDEENWETVYRAALEEVRPKSVSEEELDIKETRLHAASLPFRPSSSSSSHRRSVVATPLSNVDTVESEGDDDIDGFDCDGAESGDVIVVQPTKRATSGLGGEKRVSFREEASQLKSNSFDTANRSKSMPKLVHRGTHVSITDLKRQNRLLRLGCDDKKRGHANESILHVHATAGEIMATELLQAATRRFIERKRRSARDQTPELPEDPSFE
eukprot:TRINITY_DN1544_c0_g1_i1.p1 TRINITY_DN1544_c0_g1~~TRINITY_DN1544_c0_g1_i1.p1  ORF type:complete len:1709 (-),score=377.65 TRINITY_DN1544_c0_g1_i1:1118-6244(-)